MQFNEIFEKTKYAFENDEVFELLMGEKGYAYQEPMVPVSIPTHNDVIFNRGIYPYYNTSSNQEKQIIVEKIFSVLQEMMESDNPVCVWWALAIIFGQKLNEIHYKKSPFTLPDQLLDDIKPYLIKHKENLIKTDAYGGQGYSLGLWGDVLRYNSLFNKYCHYILLG